MNYENQGITRFGNRIKQNRYTKTYHQNTHVFVYIYINLALSLWDFD